MTQVLVNGELWTLDPRRTLGAGGEAVVLLHGRGKQRCAVKLFRDPSDEKQAKLEALMAGGPWPACVVAPTALALEPGSGRAVGFTMPLLEGGEPIALLSRAPWRAARGLGRKGVAELVTRLGECLAAIHGAGLVVGDLNDQNEMVDAKGGVWFIDADSFQIGRLSCAVASELFLDPLLYGPDPASPCLSAEPRRFSAASDWYAFAVIAFRSLTGIHPYGGAHPTLGTIAARARARVSVFDASVNLPTPAREGIATLTRALRDQFERGFAASEREVFDLRTLRAFALEIVRCSCGLELPASRLPCPRCAPIARVVLPAPPSRVSFREAVATPVAEGTARDGVYALVRGWLFVDTSGASIPVATVVEGQARFATEARVEGALLAEQRFGDRVYRFVRRRVVVDLDVSALDRGERLVDEALVLGDGVVAILRVTQRAGERRVRSAWFAFSPASDCKVVASHALDVAAGARVAGESISGGVLVRSSYLVATDRGLVREDLLGRAAAVEFAAPHDVVRDGSRLSLRPAGLVAETGGRAFTLEVLA